MALQRGDIREWGGDAVSAELRLAETGLAFIFVERRRKRRNKEGRKEGEEVEVGLGHTTWSPVKRDQ